MREKIISLLRNIKQTIYNFGLSIEPIGDISVVHSLGQDDLKALIYKGDPISSFVFSCPISRVRSWGGRSINNDHPQVASLNYYKETGDKNFKNSPYYKFSSDYNKNIFTASQALGLDQKNAPGLHDHDPKASIYPWTLYGPEKELEVFYKTLHSEHGYEFNDSPENKNIRLHDVFLERGQKEIDRLIHVFNSIQKNNYQRSTKYDGDICANILYRESEWVVLVTRGMHRIAALGAIGSKEVPIRIRRSDIIKYSDLEYLPNVINGNITLEGAELVFNSIFNYNAKGVYVNVVGWP